MSERNQSRNLYAVRSPAPHEGVGRALRGAYAGAESQLPSDFTALLAKLG